MDCSRHAERPNNARPTAHVARLFACAGVMLVAFHLRRLRDRESDTGYDTRRRASDGALAGVSQTTVYDTCWIGYARVSKADGSQSLDLQRDALQVEGVAAKSTVVRGEVSSPTHE